MIKKQKCGIICSVRKVMKMDLALYSKLLSQDETNHDISYEDFKNYAAHPINRNKRLELIDGKIVFMAGNANLNHHRVADEIRDRLKRHLKGGRYEILIDFNLRLVNARLGECKNSYQPDIMVHCTEKTKIKGSENVLRGVPEFIAEVISKSTGDYDYSQKKDIYLKYGVKEVWLVDLPKNKIVVYSNKNRRDYTFYDEIETGVFPGLVIDFGEILEIVDTSELPWFE